MQVPALWLRQTLPNWQGVSACGRPDHCSCCFSRCRAPRSPPLRLRGMARAAADWGGISPGAASAGSVVCDDALNQWARALWKRPAG